MRTANEKRFRVSGADVVMYCYFEFDKYNKLRGSIWPITIRSGEKFDSGEKK